MITKIFANLLAFSAWATVIVLGILNWYGKIDISWWWVFSPILFILAFGIFVVGVGLAYFKTKVYQYHKKMEEDKKILESQK